MKKTILFIAAIVMAAVSCNKENAPESGDNPSVTGKLTATIVQTKVSYTETSEMNLQPAWEVGDEIIGFDDNGNTYTLSVASVSAQTATLEGTLPDGDFHLIYKSGAKTSDIANKTLAIDYTAQAGDKTMPAVMLADGTVEDGACDFKFRNACAIVGISAVKGVPMGSTISKVSISSGISVQNVVLEGGSLTMADAGMGTTKYTATVNANVIDASGTLSAPIYLAIPDGTKISKVELNVGQAIYLYPLPTARKVSACDYLYVNKQIFRGYVTIGGKKWATYNVGAESLEDYGWRFQHGNTTGYIKKGSTFVEALDDSKVLTGGFIESNYTSTPGASLAQPTYTKIPSNATYDAARANWGGTWRIPTSKELFGLKEQCDAVLDGGIIYLTEKGVSLNADKSNALLLIPASGQCSGTSISNAGKQAFLWTSDIASSVTNRGLIMYRGGWESSSSYGYYGYCVRAIMD